MPAPSFRKIAEHELCKNMHRPDVYINHGKLFFQVRVHEKSGIPEPGVIYEKFDIQILDLLVAFPHRLGI